MEQDLDGRGYVCIKNLLDDDQCRTLISGFDTGTLYRRHIIMQRHGYGQGEYKYFDYPLPDIIAGLREEFYTALAPLANRWSDQLRTGIAYPKTLAEYTRVCRAAGQIKPTPLILKYETGDYNRLHQDLYGSLMFPMQMTILLSDPDTDFVGGEFILTEQRPRQQSRATVIPLRKGDAVIFAVNERPVMGKSRFIRTRMRHGVSDVRRGHRFTLGVIFHDAA
ncbi:2OG-Fe(II) oxygenase [Sneathiella sp.]|uniref:2OG-Fe(II) oxygenase n=1 Tax=Sneathiella sp. TaxID=1964365 RepID=UPI003561812B